MKELKVGERITIECVRDKEEAQSICKNCVFLDGGCGCIPCDGCDRTDENSVKFVEVKARTFTTEELEKLKADVRKETIEEACNNVFKILMSTTHLLGDACDEISNLLKKSMEETK